VYFSIKIGDTEWAEKGREQLTGFLSPR